MISGMYSLVKAAGVAEKKLDTVANNLANANTAGYKEDQLSFKEVLSTAQKVAPESEEEQFLSHEYMDQYVGMEKSAVVVDEVGKNFSIGRIHQTNNPLDVAIENEGFFTVATPQGERYTRAGNFRMDSKGQLVTHDGFSVLGEKGPIIVRGKDVVISQDGQVQVDGRTVDTLRTARFRWPDRLQKLGHSFFAPVDSDNVPLPSKEIVLRQGAIEGSNVDTVREMTRMIEASRSYEGVQRAMNSIDGLNEKAISISRV